jgi:hypothetical protein
MAMTEMRKARLGGILPGGSPRSGPRRHWLRNGLILLALAALIGLSLQWQRLHAEALAGSAVGARIGCACHYVEGRPLDQCGSDFEPGMRLIRLGDDPATKTITAGVPLLAHQRAHFVAGQGCIPDRWPG